MATYKDLEKLEKSCLVLLENCSSFSVVENEKRVREAQKVLFHAIRKLAIAIEFKNRQIISVSGLQGAGKSTMMQTFFGLPEGILKVSTGRGEQIPVLISEHGNCKKYETYAICLERSDSGYKRVEKGISPDEFIKYSSGDVADDDNVIYLELHLPYKRIEDSSIAFMLLPGFEDRQDYWKELIEFSLKCSNAAIFAFDQARYSKMQNKVVLEKVKKGFKDSLIYAITRCDISEETASEFRQKCITELEVHPDRIVNVGMFKDAAKNNEWIEMLSNAVCRYCNSASSATLGTNEYLIGIIQDEISPQLTLIKEILSKEDDHVIVEKIERNDALSAFDKTIEVRRRKLERSLDSKLRDAADKSCEKLQKIYSDKEFAKEMDVYEKPTTSIRRTILGEKVNDKIFARKRLLEAMKDNDGVLFAQKGFAGALNYCIEEWSPEDSQGSKYIFEGIETIGERSADEIAQIKERQNNLIHDAKLLLAKTGEPGEILKVGDLKKTCECIADMAEKYMSAYALKEIYQVNQKCTEGIHLENLQVDLKETIQKINTFDKVVLSGLGITGADLLGDGVINAIPVIAESIGVSVPVVGGVAAAIAAVGASGAIAKDINRLQLTEESAGEAKIREISRQIKQDFLDAYDEAMSLIRNQIERRIEDIRGNNSQVGKRINAVGTVNYLETQINGLRIGINAESSDLRNAFR